MTPYDRALAFILGWEGGSSSDPLDRAAHQALAAGQTIHTVRGITQATYDDWLLSKGELPRPVVEIEIADVAAIYHSLFWVPAWCDRLVDAEMPRLAECIMDGSVQHGVGTSVRLWQRMVRSPVDGVAGPHTLGATVLRRNAVGEDLLCAAYLDRRVGLYESIILRDRSQERFRDGWRNRLEALCADINIAPVWDT